jgi:hypothetical protein
MRLDYILSMEHLYSPRYCDCQGENAGTATLSAGACFEGRRGESPRGMRPKWERATFSDSSRLTSGSLRRGTRGARTVDFSGSRRQRPCAPSTFATTRASGPWSFLLAASERAATSVRVLYRDQRERREVVRRARQVAPAHPLSRLWTVPSQGTGHRAPIDGEQSQSIRNLHESIGDPGRRHARRLRRPGPGDDQHRWRARRRPASRACGREDRRGEQEQHEAMHSRPPNIERGRHLRPVIRARVAVSDSRWAFPV